MTKDQYRYRITTVNSILGKGELVLILKHVLKNIRENKFRSILIIVSLTLSSMVLFMNLSIKDDMMANFESLLQGAYQKYDISVMPASSAGQPEFDTSELDLSGVPVQYELDELEIYGVMNTPQGGITVGLDGFDRDLLVKTNLCVLKESSGFDANNGSQVIISQAISSTYGLSLGDPLVIITSWGTEHFTVGAIADDTGLYSAPGDSVFLMVSKKYIEEKSSQSGLSFRTFLDLKDASDVAAAVNTLSANNPGYTVEPLHDTASFQQYTTRCNSILLIMLMLVVVLNFYVVSSITKLLLAVRIPVVGTFRSIGATKNQVNGILLLENAVYGCIGGVLGVALGIAAHGLVLRAFMTSSYYGSNTKTAPVNVLYVFAVIVFCVLLQIVITSGIIRKVSHMPIKDTLFNVQNVVQHVSGRKSVLGAVLLLASLACHFLNIKYSLLPAVLSFGVAVAGAVCLVPLVTRILSKGLAFINQKIFGNAAELGAKNISYSKSITSSVVLVMVALSVLLSMYILTLSSANVFKSGAFPNSDIQIWGMQKPYTEDTFLEDVEGVSSVQFTYYAETTLSKGSKDFDLGMMPMDKSQFDILDLNHLMPKLKDNELLIDKYFAVRNDIFIGDELTQADKNLTFKVVGYVDSSGYRPSRNTCVISIPYFIANESNIPETVHIGTSQDLKTVKERLKVALAGQDVYIQTTEEAVSAANQSVSGILMLTWVMFGCAGLLAVIGLVNNQMIGFLQRRKEYVVLYSVSMSKAQLQGMIFFQVMGTFMIGTVLGTAFSLWLKVLLDDIMFAIGLCLPMNFEIGSVILASLGVFGLLMLTVLSPMRHLAKMNVVDEIKYE